MATRAIILAVMVGLTSAPASGQSPAASGGLLVSPADLAARLRDPNLVLLHIADRVSVYEQGHIPGARFVRYGDIAVDGPEDLGSELPPIADLTRALQTAGVSSTSRVVIYGSSTVAAARLFFTLDVAGHPRVALLDGGLRAWRAEQRPVDTGSGRSGPQGQFRPAYNLTRLISAQQIQDRVAAGAISLVDVRPDPEFLGTDGGMGGAHAAGHVAGARQLPWDTLVAGDGRFLPRDQLQARLGTAGVVPGRPVAAYCMVGMRASVVYFVARHLGYDAQLYDGSIVDWSRRKLPVRQGR